MPVNSENLYSPCRAESTPALTYDYEEVDFRLIILSLFKCKFAVVPRGGGGGGSLRVKSREKCVDQTGPDRRAKKVKTHTNGRTAGHAWPQKVKYGQVRMTYYCVFEKEN